MSTPELPPPNAYFWTPKPGSGLRPELKSWSTNCGPHPQWDVVGYYTAEEVAAAVLAEQAKSEAMRAALDADAGESDLHDMVRWAYSKLHHATYSKQEDALMLDRMKLRLEHGA